MNIFHGLLFQGGHIVDPQLAVRLGRVEASGEPTAPSPAPAPRRSTPRLRWLLEELVLLGGRPVPKERCDDINDPFPTLHPCR